MVKFWRGKGGPGKEECFADDQEQRELKTRYNNGCCAAVISQYCLSFLELNFECSIYVVCVPRHCWLCFKLMQTKEGEHGKCCFSTFQIPLLCSLVECCFSTVALHNAAWAFSNNAELLLCCQIQVLFQWGRGRDLRFALCKSRTSTVHYAWMGQGSLFIVTSFLPPSLP